MATLARLRYVWSGTGIVGGGVSTFYSSNSDPATLNAAIRAFFLANNGLFPSSVSIIPPGSGDTIESTTGVLNGSWSMTAPALVVGAGSGSWAAGVGLRVVWNTAGITRGRRVRGSTFLVPLTTAFYDTNGNIADATWLNVQNSAETLRAADGGSMRIYSRPSAPGVGDGVAHPITSARVPDVVSWLRSRRT